MTTGKTLTAAIALPGAIITGTLILVLAGVTSTTPRPTHTPGAGTLNEHAVPTWAIPLLHAAATTCPAITAPLLAAQIDTESAWNPTAYNTHSQAEGLAQFIPGLSGERLPLWHPPLDTERCRSPDRSELGSGTGTRSEWARAELARPGDVSRIEGGSLEVGRLTRMQARLSDM